MKRIGAVFLIACTLIFTAIGMAQSLPHETYDSMRWRMIGPHRGGRTVGATGVPSKPNEFYIGVNNGGVWKTIDYGRTWVPIFDDQPTGSIGTLAVAQSNPDIVYVGSGEGLQRPDLSTGDGIYKSIDAGTTWTHLGLRDGQQIGDIIVDPKNPDRLFVAVLGHPYGANKERGVYRSVDSGKTFQNVLYKDENTGAIALEFDPRNSQVVFASLWAARQGPWENGAWQGNTSGLFKSEDGGESWRQIVNGLPENPGRIGFDISLSNPDCMYAICAQSVFRSNDAGESWTLVNADRRVASRPGDFEEIQIHPKNPEIVYSANVAAYQSTDGGKNFEAVRGAPGGDDYHTIWINPENPDIMLFASDQGAIITVNGGQTFSSWYNQPTAQFYHVITDDQYPYWVYGGQQESGSVGITSRGADGQITFRDWHPVGAEEYAYVAPDPLDPNIIYGGKVTRFDKRTRIVENVGPPGRHRVLRTAPLVFSKVDPRALYYGTNTLFKTVDDGKNWSEISPDLSREQPEVPDSIGIYRTEEMETQARRGVIYTVAPSYVAADTIWAGTDDGLIHVSSDGGTSWKDVTPPELTAWSKVSLIDSGRFDKNTAYAAINRIRLSDQSPWIFRTHDGGKTWKKVVNGLPNNEPINSVREDSVRKGLLFAGSERAVYFSLDDGENWMPLRLNMPATSIRDLVVQRGDVVVGTHGRSFWILDDITPLRQLTAEIKTAKAVLFKPRDVFLYPTNTNTDTPIPQEEPAGQNPPDGAIINYYLGQEPAGPIVLEIVDDAGDLVRRYASDDAPIIIDKNTLSFPEYWVRPPAVLSSTAGSHRFVWDGYYTPVPTEQPRFPIAAIFQNTAPNPTSPRAKPGGYTVKLSVDGQSFEQPLTLHPDPRILPPKAK